MNELHAVLASAALLATAGGVLAAKIRPKRRAEGPADEVSTAEARPVDGEFLHRPDDCTAPYHVSIRPGTRWRCRCSQVWRLEDREDWPCPRWIRVDG